MHFTKKINIPYIKDYWITNGYKAIINEENNLILILNIFINKERFLKWVIYYIYFVQ